MKLSHSGINTYTTCGHSYKLQYVDKIVSKYKGSALYFGSAIDEALNYMLLNKDDKNVLDDTILIFEEHWRVNIDKNGVKTEMENNPFILYSKWDFEPDLLEKSDWSILFKNAKDPFGFRKEIEEKLKTVNFEDLDVVEQSFYNLGTWLCLKRKGAILLKAYYEQLIPNIKEVIAVQKTYSLVDENGDILNGVIDFVCRLNDGTIVVADNKTSSLEYENDSVKTSTQLSLYKRVLNIFNEDPNNEWKVGNIENAAYFVVSKKLIKNVTKTCVRCGHIGEGSHKTCDGTNEEGERCGGDWEKVKSFHANTQLIVDTIPETVQDMVLENADNIKNMIKQEIFPKNFSSCNGKFGRCQYFDLCWFKNDKNLKKS